MPSKSGIKPFLEATRPKTLAASIVPVSMGAAAASRVAKIDWFLLVVIFVCALFIQIISNFINEIYDFKRGADNSERLGPRRQVATGAISVKSMTVASIALIIATFLIGLILVWHSGVAILIAGIASLFFAFAYTGGPYPLAYNGLGEIFVIIFFGLVAVNGTYFVFTGKLDFISLFASLPPGMLSANLLAANNIRDIETDRKANKRTLAVKIGKAKAIILYRAFIVFSFLSIVVLFVLTNNPLILLPFLSMPYSLQLFKNIAIKQGAELNLVLAGTAKHLLAFGLLAAIGFIIN